MAKETIVQIIDDIDGSKADTTVRFSWKGRSYEIDLSNKNARAFDTAIEPYLKAATRTPGSVKPSGRRAGRRSGTDVSAVRAWATENGHAVSARGRIPSTVVEAYEAAHGDHASTGRSSARKSAPAARRRRPAAKAGR